MKWHGVLMAGALGVLAGVPMAAQAQTPGFNPRQAQAPGFNLKQGCNYAIGFQENMAPGVGQSMGPGSAVAAPGGRNVAVYRVLGSTADQQWYRLRMVARAPQGGWYTPPGTPEVWVNLSYATWVQEVLR